MRIGIYLTLVSAGVVSLALIGQATDFDGNFRAFAIVLFSILLVVGTLTLLRVLNGSQEDLACVIGMNRLRAGYSELDPGIERYFITSAHDNDRGIDQTYAFFGGVSSAVQVAASGAMFILVVDAVVASVLGVLVAYAAGGSGGVIAIAAVASGTLYSVVWFLYAFVASAPRSVSTTRCFPITRRMGREGSQALHLAGQATTTPDPIGKECAML